MLHSVPIAIGESLLVAHAAPGECAMSPLQDRSSAVVIPAISGIVSDDPLEKSFRDFDQFVRQAQSRALAEHRDFLFEVNVDAAEKHRHPRTFISLIERERQV